MKKKRSSFIYLNSLLLMAIVSVVSSCKKDDEVSSTDVNKEVGYASEVYNAMKDIYLWNTALPSTFDVSKYPTAQKTLDYLSSLKINPDTKEAIDRYSFLDEVGSLSGEISTGTTSGDMGFMIQPAYNSSNEISFYVIYVYKNSPAGKAGVERTYEITKINGSTDVHPTLQNGTSLNTASSGYKNVINAFYATTATSFTFTRPDGTSITTTLTPASYTINSVLCDSVFSTGSSKTGYLVFNQFLGTSSQNELSKTISKFESQGVDRVIVDLRYNGGGSVATCEYFCNLLAPASATNKTMYEYKFNSKLTEEYKNEVTTVLFNKSNSLAPKSLYFIVSSYTASASELLINNLRPYYSGNIFLIGDTTYGKPCGFWATPIGYTENQTSNIHGYDLYAVSFATVNANNEGGYYTGMAPGSTTYPGVTANDYISVPWGNTADPCLAQALYHISNNAFSSAKTAVKSGYSRLPIMNDDINLGFKGMIDFDRLRNRK